MNRTRFTPDRRVRAMRRLASAFAAILASASFAACAQPASTPAVSDPKLPRTAIEQIRRILGEGRAREALAASEQALVQFPRDPQIRFLNAVSLAEADRKDDAIAAFETLTREFPELPEPYNNLAVLYAGRGELDRARATLEQAIRAQPQYALALENLGDIHLRLAARAYEQAGRADPANAAARQKLGMARELLGRIASTAGTPAPQR